MSTLKLSGLTNGSSILKAPDTGSTGVTFTLPASAGTLLTTTGSGANLTGISSVGGATGVDFNDNTKARFGTGNDLEIFHDGSHSRIKDVGTGNLYINGSAQVNIQDAAGEPMINCVADGAVQLAHHGDYKLATSATGVTVTGAIAGATNLGKVLQVAVASITGGVTSTSSTYATTGLNCAMTPSSTSSKLLVTVMGSQAVSWDNDVGTILSIFRGDSGGTNLLGGSSEGGYIVYASVGTGKVAFPISMQVLDSPSTTSSVDYYMKLRTRDNGNTSKLNWLGGEIYMTVMEIAG